LAPGASDGVERAGQGEIVEVVPGGLGERAILPPAGHAAEDEPWIARQHGLRPEA
jgi:hypothetical protein